MYPFFRRLLFRLDPEFAHWLTLRLLALATFPPLGGLLARAFRAPQRPVRAFGLTFPNPVGLAAGYDKDARAVRGLAALGFGHIEVGTVTPRPQPGNPRPRVFRLPEDRALINRMGFPGRGAEFVARRLRHRPPGVVVGVNLGKNADTPLEEAARDYLALLRRFSPLADYLAINISSPNTLGLRRLQGRELLSALLRALAAERQTIVAEGGRRPPVLVKLSPDLTPDELSDALDAIVSAGLDGVIVSNTTLAREGLRSARAAEAGGLSGDPLRGRSEAALTATVRALDGRLPVISVGGIMSPEDAKRRLDLGAALVQIYTGLVYAGPGLVRDILRALA